MTGAFICIYVGNLFENEEGNKQGQNFGDEYFADLDLIEIVERQKVSLLFLPVVIRSQLRAAVQHMHRYKYTSTNIRSFMTLQLTKI